MREFALRPGKGVGGLLAPLWAGMFLRASPELKAYLEAQVCFSFVPQAFQEKLRLRKQRPFQPRMKAKDACGCFPLDADNGTGEPTPLGLGRGEKSQGWWDTCQLPGRLWEERELPLKGTAIPGCWTESLPLLGCGCLAGLCGCL